MAPPHGRAGHGLYDPAYEHDACGVAFVARLGAPASHEVISRALWALEHLEHRGAEGADPDTGDGAGILVQLPDELLRGEVGLRAAATPGRYGVAVCFLPAATSSPASTPSACSSETVAQEGQRVLGWRDVPIDADALRHAPRARSCPASASCSSARATAWRTRTPSSASST